MDKKFEFLSARDGRGKEISDQLRAELKIPGSAKWFEVRFAVDEPVTVRCEYVPRLLQGSRDDG